MNDIDDNDNNTDNNDHTDNDSDDDDDEPTKEGSQKKINGDHSSRFSPTKTQRNGLKTILLPGCEPLTDCFDAIDPPSLYFTFTTLTDIFSQSTVAQRKAKNISVTLKMVSNDKVFLLKLGFVLFRCFFAEPNAFQIISNELWLILHEGNLR